MGERKMWECIMNSLLQNYWIDQLSRRGIKPVKLLWLRCVEWRLLAVGGPEVACKRNGRIKVRDLITIDKRDLVIRGPVDRRCINAHAGHIIVKQLRATLRESHIVEGSPGSSLVWLQRGKRDWTRCSSRDLLLSTGKLFRVTVRTVFFRHRLAITVSFLHLFQWLSDCVCR